ncbi:kinesin-like protein KIN-7N, partial [Tanacetum coccineum]
DGTLGQQITSWKAEVSGEIKLIKERYEILEQESDINNHLLEASKERIHGLENESQLVTEERDKLLIATLDSSKTLASLTQQNEKILQDLACEIRRRKDLEEKIRQFSITYASRQNSLMSFHTEFRSKIDYLKAQSPVVSSSVSPR